MTYGSTNDRREGSNTDEVKEEDQNKG